MRWFVVSPVIAVQMIEHAADESPREACGLLVGDGSENLMQAVRTTNIEARPDRFLVDPVEHHRIMREGDAAGLSIIGVYHSHPGGPSGVSAVDMAAPIDPHWISLVVSPRPDGWRIRAFRIRGGIPHELAIVEKRPIASLR